MQEAVRNCENYLKEHFPAHHELVNNAPNPFPLGYDPNMDTSLDLPPEEASYF